MNNPIKPGKYLILAFEWTGLYKEKPAQPQWFIRSWYQAVSPGVGHWERQKYYWDTGGYEYFEVVRWQELPPTTP